MGDRLVDCNLGGLTTVERAKNMEQENQPSMLVLRSSELVPIVSQAIEKPHIDSLDWQVQPVSGIGGGKATGTVGLFRLSGTAEVDGQKYPWSVIVKVFNRAGISDVGQETFQDPSAWNYWKREILAYSSGILSELDGNLMAPRFYGVTEHANDEWRIWLEDIEETTKVWSIERHGLAARHLGQFNGSYLTHRTLPDEQPWLYRGRTREWVKQAEAMFEGLGRYATTVDGRRW